MQYTMFVYTIIHAMRDMTGELPRTCSMLLRTTTRTSDDTRLASRPCKNKSAPYLV